MKPAFIFALGTALCVAFFAGCGGKKDEHGAEAEKSGDGHGHEEAPAGATFKPGKGIILTSETRTNLGIVIADVTERIVPNEVHFNLQVFGEKHHHTLGELDHTGCDVHGSGLVATKEGAVINAGQPVQVRKGSNALNGVVIKVAKSLALGDSEIVVGVSNASTLLKSGDFVAGKIVVDRKDTVVAVPKTGVLRTSEGTFVYTVNGDAYFRTPVKIGAEANGFVEILDGLLSGDQIVTKPVETLWLIELRATKGGGHSH